MKRTNNCASHNGEIILAIIFLISNLSLIAFSIPSIYYLSLNNACYLTVYLGSIEQQEDFNKSDRFHDVNKYGERYTYVAEYSGVYKEEDETRGRDLFLEITLAVIILVLIASSISIVTTPIKYFADLNELERLKIHKKCFSNLRPKIVKIAAFVGSTAQIVVYCSMTAILIAAIIEADFDKNFAADVAGVVNDTLSDDAKMPMLVEDEIEALYVAESDTCWISVYIWMDKDPIVRFGLLLFVVSALEIISILSGSAILNPPPTSDKKYIILPTSKGYENEAMEAAAF